MSTSFLLFKRIIFRNREAYSIKIITLAVAFATSIAITLFCLNEFGYDRFHKGAQQVFRVIKKNQDEHYNGNRVSSKIDAVFVQFLKQMHRDSLIVSRVKIMERVNVIANEHTVFDQKIHAVDPSIDQIFSIDCIQGNIHAFKNEPNTSVIVSSGFAEMNWGSTDIAGQELKLFTSKDTLSVPITAVFRSFPENSHEKFDVFISFNTNTVERLNFDPEETGVYGRAFSKKPGLFEFPLQQMTRYSLQPIKQIYFGPRVIGEAADHGDRYSVIILVCIASLIFFLAVTTFINLTAITLPYRSKELAVKKLAGMTREWLVLGFLKESLSIVVISYLLSIAILLSVDPLSKSILEFSITRRILIPDLTATMIILGMFTVLTLSPILMTLRFVEATPNRLLSTDTISFPALKRYITLVQLGVSIFLIIASIVVKRQINYSLVKEPGQNFDQIVFLNSPSGITNTGVNSLRNGWQQHNPNILDVMAVSQLPDRISSKEVNSNLYQLSVDRGYREFFNLEMLEGNWFGPNSPDSAFVINKSAKTIMGAPGKPVLDVIADVNGIFNHPEKPTKFTVGTDHGYQWLCVRVLEVDIRRTVQRLSEGFSTASTKAEVRYLNEQFQKWIHYQDRLNKLSGILAIIAAILSCLAIYALSISMVRDKLKQIALHQIFGATTLNIAKLLMWDFIRQLGIALLVFLPVSYVILNELLRTFIYSTKFSLLDPVYPLGYCAIVIIIISIFQAWNLKRTNSIAALKG